MVAPRSWGLGFLCWTLWCIDADRLIEIVEEQHCHDHLFRLTCRDLETHLAILEAWYTTVDDHQNPPKQKHSKTNEKLYKRIDDELNQVYLYSSPKHDGYYLPLKNSSINKNVKNSNFERNPLLNKSEHYVVNESERFTVNESGNTVNKSVIEIAEMLSEKDVEAECGGMAFLKSYSSTREGMNRRMVATRDSSINLRSPVTYRCAGVNHCTFLLAEDYPPSKSWSPGIVSVKYACFDDTFSVHYCNREVFITETGEQSEGYIRTPGYPHFYIGEECHWRLLVHPEQRIRLTVLDVSLRSIQMPYEKDCTDYIIIEDSSGETLLSSCEQVEMPVMLLSETNKVEIAVKTGSEGAFPKRGVLVHYKSIGCVTLPTPPNGYMVYRNAELAHYMCNVNHVFVDTRQRARVVRCYEDNKWNDSVPYCIEETSLTGDVSSDNWSPARTPLTTTTLPHEPNMIVDIVIPSLLIAALIIGNAFIVIVIYKYRKRKNDDCEDEFNTIPANGNGHTAGNAV